jgi:hypothetical protein
MRQVNVLYEIMDCFVGILDRVFDARWQMNFQVFQPVFGHDQSLYAGDPVCGPLLRHEWYMLIGLQKKTLRMMFSGTDLASMYRNEMWVIAA